jgi:hypothetical protein
MAGTANALPIFAGNDYDASTGTGGTAMSGQLGPPHISNTGFAVGNGDSKVAGVSKGYGVFRWSPTLAPELLGSLGNDNQGRSFPKSSAINDAGTVVGVATRSPNGISNTSRPARWDFGSTTVIELGPDEPTLFGSAVGVDSAGNAFGNVGAAAPFPRRWMAGTTISLPMLTLGAPTTGNGTGTVSYVGATGVAAGTATLYNASGQAISSRPVRWDSPTATPVELGMYNGSSAKLGGMNDLGGIVGRFGTSGVYYAPGSTAPALLQDLEGGNTRSAFPAALGNGGAIVGTLNKYVNNTFAYVAPVVWPTPTSTPIELQSDNHGARTTAAAINSTGHSVGQTYDLTVSPNVIKSWLWSIDGSGVAIQSFVDDPRWTIQSATDISDTGWVVGEATYDPDGTAGPIASYRRFYSILIPQAGTYGSGDATFDAKVNFADLVLLAQYYGEPSNGRVDVADLNLDGTTNFADLVILAQNYDTGAAALGDDPPDIAADWALAQSFVPEPATAIAASISIVMAARRYRCS